MKGFKLPRVASMACLSRCHRHGRDWRRAEPSRGFAAPIGELSGLPAAFHKGYL